jgi:hypothetical protein
MNSYDSGWTIILALVGGPLLFLFLLWSLVQVTTRTLARGLEYRSGHAEFVGLWQMIGLNLLLPGSGLFAGGFTIQGGICLFLWVGIVITGLKYSAMLQRNLTVYHLFSGIWASVVASQEVTRQAQVQVRDERKKLKKVNLHRQRVPTLEDPDQYLVRLKAFQLVLEASADPRGRFDAIQTATVHRIKSLLRIEERTFGQLLEQLRVEGDARRTLGDGARLGSTSVFEKVLPIAVDHPAFENLRDNFLEAAASLLGIPAKEALSRRKAYEEGEDFTSDEYSLDGESRTTGSYTGSESYTYTYGDSESGSRGSESQTYTDGDSRSYTEGDSRSYTEGDSASASEDGRLARRMSTSWESSPEEDWGESDVTSLSLSLPPEDPDAPDSGEEPEDATEVNPPKPPPPRRPGS